MGYTRKPPHQDRKSLDIEYIEKIINPATPEDLMLALREPLSPAFKEFVNLLQQELEEEVIIERLIEKFIMQEHQLRHKEKEAILRQMHIKSDSDKEFAIYIAAEREKNERLRAAIAMATQARLQEIEKDLQRRLQKSDTQIKKINASIHLLQKKSDEITHRYQQQLMTSFENKKDEMSFVAIKTDKNGERVSVQLKDPMKSLKEIVKESPPPVDLVNRIEKSYEDASKAQSIAMAQAATAIAFMPPPPPPPLLKPKAAYYAAHDRLNVEFKMITQKLVDSSNPADILTVIKTNNCLKKVFCQTEDEKEQQCAIFKEAMEIGAKLRKGIHQLELARENFVQDSQLLHAVMEKKQQLFGEDLNDKFIDRNSHL